MFNTMVKDLISTKLILLFGEIYKVYHYLHCLYFIKNFFLVLKNYEEGNSLP